MSMTHCLKYLVDLREQNQRIHKLQGDINRFTRNEHHCEILDKEYKDACKELEGLSEKWNHAYVPAIERGQRARNELYVARNQPELFQRLIHEELAEKDSVQIRSKIKALQDSIIITKFSIAGEMQGPRNPEKEGRDSDEPEDTNVHRSRRSHSSWALRTAIEQVRALEEQHKELSLKMRYVGSHSCALSAQLKVTKTKLDDLKEAMKLPAELLYKDLEKELSTMKIQAYEEHLSKRSSSNQYKFKLSAVNTQRGRSSFVYRQKHARSRSDVTSRTAPSLTASLASTLTDSSAAGNDFLKSTEATLDEVTARWRVPGYWSSSY